MAIGTVLAFRLAPDGWELVWSVTGSVVGAGLGVGSFLALQVLLETHRLVRESDERLTALLNVRPLTGALPIDLGGWAADPSLMDTVLRIILRMGARSIVECGSGWSTVLIASCLSELRCGRVLALEHDRQFAERTRAWLIDYGVADRAKVVDAPLAPRIIHGDEWPWYGPAADQAIDRKIDLLLVDGPPGRTGHRSRYPAVPLLAGKLAGRSIVLLDDGFRADERWIAERWSEELGIRPHLLPCSRGIWLFDPGSGSDPRLEGRLG